MRDLWRSDNPTDWLSRTPPPAKSPFRENRHRQPFSSLSSVKWIIFNLHSAPPSFAMSSDRPTQTQRPATGASRVLAGGQPTRLPTNVAQSAVAWDEDVPIESDRDDVSSSELAAAARGPDSC
jgi:hypothetical protein